MVDDLRVSDKDRRTHIVIGAVCTGAYNPDVNGECSIQLDVIVPLVLIRCTTANRVTLDGGEAAAVVLDLEVKRDAGAENVAFVSTTLQSRDCETDANGVNVSVSNLTSYRRCLFDFGVD